MENLSELKRRIIEYLAGLTAFEEAVIVAAYPEKQRQYPLKTPVITIEAAGAELSSAGFGGYLGGDVPRYGANAVITLRFGIHHTAAEGCGLIFEALCNALFDASWLGLQRINCERAEYDTKTAAYLLPVTAVLKAAWIVPKPQERLFEQIYLKDVKL